ncbi:MAG TPA: hypothetical protein VIZ28_11730 [Chitinophagaceae bacterium]
MRRFALLLAPVLIMAFSKADWITIKLDKRVSVDFPYQPETSETNGNAIWSTNKDTAFKCMAMVVNFAQFGLDSAAVAKELDGEPFYAGFKSSMLEKMKGASVLSEEITKVNGWPAYKLTVALGSNANNMDRVYISNIFVGDKMYSLSFYESTARPQLISRKKFLESVIIK